MVEVKYVAGIDPGVKTGLAFYDRTTKKIESVRTIDFWTCIDLFRDWDTSYIEVVIETPLKNVMYQQYEGEQAKGSLKRGNRMMANVSSNATEARLLADGLERMGFKVTRVKPTRRNFKSAEEDVAYVKRMTGFDGKSNPHTRDAIMLCFGL